MVVAGFSRSVSRVRTVIIVTARRHGPGDSQSNEISEERNGHAKEKLEPEIRLFDTSDSREKGCSQRTDNKWNTEVQEIRRMISLRLSVRIIRRPEQTHFPLVRVFNRFYAEKNIRTYHRNDNIDNRSTMVLQLRATYGPSHRQTAEKKHNRVQAAQPFVEMHMCRLENFRVVIPIDDVSDKKTTEKQDLLNEKQPHSEFSGIKLLLSRFKMVRNERTIGMFMMTMVVVMTMALVGVF